MLESKHFKKISLNASVIQSLTTTEGALFSLIGKEGKTATTLRPSGMIELDGNRYDAYTSGELIENDETIVVIEVFNGTLKVKKV